MTAVCAVWCVVVASASPEVPKGVLVTLGGKPTAPAIVALAAADRTHPPPAGPRRGRRARFWGVANPEDPVRIVTKRDIADPVSDRHGRVPVDGQLWILMSRSGFHRLNASPVFTCSVFPCPR